MERSSRRNDTTGEPDEGKAFKSGSERSCWKSTLINMIKQLAGSLLYYRLSLESVSIAKVTQQKCLDRIGRVRRAYCYAPLP